MGEIAAVQVTENGWDEQEPPSPIDPRRASFPRPPTPTPELDLLRDLDTPASSHPFNATLGSGGQVEQPSPAPRRTKRASLPPPPLKLRPGAVYDTAPLSAPLLCSQRPGPPFPASPLALESAVDPPPPPQVAQESASASYIPSMVHILSLISMLPMPLLHLLLSWPWHKTAAWQTNPLEKEADEVQGDLGYGYDNGEYDLVEDCDDDAEEEEENADEWEEYDSDWSDDPVRTASIEVWRSATAVEVELRHKNWPAPPSPPFVHRTEDGLLDW